MATKKGHQHFGNNRVHPQQKS